MVQERPPAMVQERPPAMRYQTQEDRFEAMMGADMQSQMRSAMARSEWSGRAAAIPPAPEGQSARVPTYSARPTAAEIIQPGRMGHAELDKLEEIERRRQLQRQQEMMTVAPAAGGASSMRAARALSYPDASSAADVNSAADLALRIAARLPPSTSKQTVSFLPGMTTTGSYQMTNTRGSSRASGLLQLIGTRSTRAFVDYDVGEEKYMDASGAGRRSLTSGRDREGLRGGMQGEDGDGYPAGGVRRRWEAPPSASEEVVRIRDLQRSELIGGWTEEVRGLSAAVTRMETAQEAVRITRMQADAGRRERQASAKGVSCRAQEHGYRICCTCGSRVDVLYGVIS